MSEASTVAGAMAGLASRPSWILLDLMLPDGCGSDVLRKVRAERLDIKVCVVTGCGPALLDEVRTLGAEEVLTKPLNVDLLLATLAK